MLSHSESQRVPYDIETVFHLVSDVESYPKFLPWVLEARIYDRKGPHFKADLMIGKRQFSGLYTSRILLRPFDWIEAKLVQGIFQSLNCRWTFRSVQLHQTDVHFSIKFECKNPLLNLFFSPLLPDIAGAIFRSFLSRAEVVKTAAPIRTSM